MKTILVLLLSVLLHTSVAQACSCINAGGSEKQKVKAAYRQDALIFVGRVVSVDTVVTTDSVRVSDMGPAAQQFQLIRHEKLRYTFAVARQFKGTPAGPTVLVASETSSAACGKQFAVDSEQLVYAFLVTQKESAYGGELEDVTPYYATSLCNRSQELKYVKRAELKQLAKASR